MTPIYSYYSREDGVLRKETLSEHIREALKAVKNMEKVLSYGLRLSRNFPLMLSLSVVLHDVGKVVYNQHFFNPNKDLSFRGHEVVSAWLIHKFTHTVDESVLKLPSEEWDVITFSVINHHHPMRIFNRCEDLTKEPFAQKEVNEDTIELFLREMEVNNVLEDKELRDIIANFKNEEFLRSVSGVKLNEIASKTCGGIYTGLWNRVWFEAKPKIRQLFLLNEQGLVVADYYSASINRGEARSDFGKAARDFIRLYSLSHHLALNGV
ncbi:MAG: hypothetical protein B7O98_09665 [Zestosphaera tikiterensis]|uniref:CRISPR-associated endonuclease Cas3 n=1 Tax=Zestosphaera tikiterensis TaxID=1973259 RepID=A0A2R7Y117_9CREN|nr:MAG: hypothetical protein B7O98_09665 [Zestosphaera tikiterensis]